MQTTNRLKCLVLEDEVMAQNLMADYFKQTPNLELTQIHTNGVDALAALQKNHFDLLFLDINVPGISGVELARHIGSDQKIIFTTASPEFAVQGFELNAVDYLVKPFTLERFHKAVAKALKTTYVSKESNQNQVDENAFIYVKSGGTMMKLFINEILLIECQRNMLLIHQTTNNVAVYGTINEFENRLPKAKFIRFHKSFIAAIDKITAFNSTTITIQHKSFPIGRSYKEETLLAIKKTS